jgi:hypothetical protein
MKIMDYNTFELMKDGFYARCKKMQAELPVELRLALIAVIKAERELTKFVEPTQ